MKKVILLFVFVVVSSHLVASVIEDNFKREGGHLPEKYHKDSLIKKAEKLLSGKNKKTIQVNGLAKKVIDFKTSFELLYKSAIKQKNPVSAYGALYILNSYYPKTENLEKKRYVLSKILYKSQKKMCIANIWYGDVLMKGIGTKKNIPFALDIFKKTDLKTCSAWRKNIVESRIINIKTNYGK